MELHVDSTSPSVSIICGDMQTASSLSSKDGWKWEMLRSKALKSGLNPEHLPIRLLADRTSPTEKVIVGLGEAPLRHFTGKKGIDKWHLSPIQLPDGRLFLGTFDFSRIQKEYALNLYLELTLQRAAEFSSPDTPYRPHVERFLLNPGIEETLIVLKMLETKEEIAVDVETGYGQINTVGFAWSESDAIAINVLPERYSDEAYFTLWNAIAKVLQSGNRKIFQNFIYDTSYFSAYGIKVEGEIFDTMHAMKVLWPELNANLGNVGRLYTKRPYWKDDGKVTDEEGKKKNWGDVRDWVKHYNYNCRDTTGTFAASKDQRYDLQDRNLWGFYVGYILKLIPCAREMCSSGMPVDNEAKKESTRENQEKLSKLVKEFTKVTNGINPKSPAQVQKYIKENGIKLPKKYNKDSGNYKESVDSSAIKKIRLKYPEMRELELLQQIKSLDKALSSYINFAVRPDGRLSYSLNVTGTETLRWSGSKDPWGRGFNIQTIPREGGDVSIKSMFLAPQGFSFMEVDLRQAESRFVAYDSADKTLIEMLESGADVHTHVGNEILRQMGRDPSGVDPVEFKSTWRQLGKKAGHGLNYGMKASIFVETVFNELDIVISRCDAEIITQAYFNLFPGIPRWHAWIRKELYNKRKLTAPSGWERYFYGRPGDDMFKEGCAWRPQHTIPWITNHLMLYLCDKRKSGELKFNLVTQVHDSLILLVENESLNVAAHLSLDHKSWHPKVVLSGGEMWIPTEVKVGKRMSELTEYLF